MREKTIRICRSGGIWKYLILLVLTFNFISCVSGQVAQTPGTYTFTLTAPAKTSAGVYTTDSTLVRTLWSVVDYAAGTYLITWDGKDDNGNQMPAGNYIVKVVSGNVNYTWEGVIGNTSTNQTGPKVHRQWVYSMSDMTIVNSKVYFCSGYSERRPSVASFSTALPQEKIDIYVDGTTNKNTDLVCTDGNIFYQGGYDPYVSDGTVHSWVSGTRISDNSDVAFSAGVPATFVSIGRAETAIGLLQTANSTITGLAVLKTGNYLFISRAGLNNIYVLNKTTGALVQTIATTNPKSLSVDGNDNLWVSYATNTIERYTVNSDGTLTSTGVKITGVTTPGSIGNDNANNKVLVVDYATQQIKFFYNTTGGVFPQAVLGQTGGYSVNSIAANDKFCFTTAALGNLLSSVKVDPANSSFWVSDAGNNRIQHFAANGNFIETVMYMPPTYSTWVNRADPTMVGAESFQFSVDYTQKLSGSTGWKFTNNWGAAIPATYNQTERFKSVHTFTSGGVTRTFGFLQQLTQAALFELVELQSNGVLRYTGILKGGYVIDEQSRLTVNLVRFAFTGFDSSNNPVWSTDSETLADISKLTDKGPISYLLLTEPGVTSTNKLILYQPQAYTNDGNGSGNVYVTGYHLGAINKGGNTWNWETEHATNVNYMGDYPPPGRFDIGNTVNYSAGSQACVYNRFIFTGYHGEFWKQGQTNKFNLYFDDGLAIGQFGTVKTDSYISSPAMMAGNALKPNVVKGLTSDELYLMHGDESFHAGIHLWRISGLNSVKEQSIAITYPLPALAAAQLPGVDLLAGLPFQATVQDGVVGWNRPAEDYTNAQAQYFSVLTGVKSYLSTALDVYIHYRMNSAATRVVTRTLNNTLSLNTWSVTGQINWDGDYSNPLDNSGGQYIEVLDNAGKIITRLYPSYTAPNGVYTTFINGNDKILLQGASNDIGIIMIHNQPFSISASAGSITFSYAGYSSVTSTLIDPTANWAVPATLRFYFFTGSNNDNRSDDRIIDIQALRFNANKVSQTITFNPLAAIQSNVAPITLTAMASSQLPITYNIISGPAQILNNVLTITGVGVVVVQATQPGNLVYSPAIPVVQSITIGTGVRVDL